MLTASIYNPQGLTFALFTVALLFGSTTPSHATAIYSYLGEPFDQIGDDVDSGALGSSVPGSYNTAMRISGSFQLMNGLAPSMETTDIAPLVVDYSFSDGRHSFDPTTSFIDEFLIATNTAGAISDWRIRINYNGYFDLEMDEMTSRLITRSFVGNSVNEFDQGVTYRCVSTTCVGVDTLQGVADWGATLGSRGTWSLVLNLPEPSTMALFGVGIAGLAFTRKRKRNETF